MPAAGLGMGFITLAVFPQSAFAGYPVRGLSLFLRISLSRAHSLSLALWLSLALERERGGETEKESGLGPISVDTAQRVVCTRS